jgi:hypothetical protein
MVEFFLNRKERRDANMICMAYFDLFQNNKPTESQVRLWIMKYQKREKLK